MRLIKYSTLNKTPKHRRRESMLFVKIQSDKLALFDEYFLVYVTAFRKLVRAAFTSINHPFYIFYPSLLFIKTEHVINAAKHSSP